MQITYANTKVEKYFSDYNRLQRKLPFAWVRSIKKFMNYLKAAECFGDFLQLGLGRPEQLEGTQRIRYSLRISILEPDATEETVMICTEVEVEGVVDYHGDKDNWFIP